MRPKYAAYYVLIALCSGIASATDMQQSIMNALYKQSGVDIYVDKTVKTLDKEYVPDVLRTNGAVVLILLQSTITHQIGWKWNF